MPNLALAPAPNWVANRQARFDAAVRFLKARCILVNVCERNAQIRQYWVSGIRPKLLAEQVIDHAVSLGAVL